MLGRRLANGFLIGDLRPTRADIQPVFAAHPVDGDVEVNLPLPPEQQFLRILPMLHPEGIILLHDLGEHGRQLDLVFPFFREKRDAVNGRQQLILGQMRGAVDCEDIPRPRLIQPPEGNDFPGPRAVAFFGFCPLKPKNAADPPGIKSLPIAHWPRPDTGE